MINYRVLVTTCEKYYPALLPFSYLFNKYWGNDVEVVVGGYGPLPFELPDNFSFVSIGDQADYPISRWSDALIKFLAMVPDEVFGLMLEDYWLIRPVKRKVVQMCFDYCRQFKYVAKFDLCADRQFAMGARDYGHIGSEVDLVISMPGSPYHMSLMTGFWRKEHLVRNLKPGWSPWDVEIVGTFGLSHDRDVIVVGTKQWPVKHALAFRAGDSGTLLLDEMPEEDIDALREMGHLAHWEDA